MESPGDCVPGLISEFAESVRLPHFTHGLLRASGALSSRGLVQATQWIVELAHSVRDDVPRSETLCSCGMEAPQPAKSFFDSRQYRRCAASLSRARDALGDGGREPALSMFLRCFATYLSVEKDSVLDAVPGSNASPKRNIELCALRTDLEGAEDPHCQYLLAVILDKLHLGREDGSVKSLLMRSLSAFPWNWAAWKKLASVVPADDAQGVVEELCADKDNIMEGVFGMASRSLDSSDDGSDSEDFDVSKLGHEECVMVGRRVMGVLFWAWACLENNRAEEARDTYTTVVGVLEKSLHFKGCLATAMYHLRMFDEAQEVFEEVFEEDEFCLDGVDTYSNILYVKEDKVRLSVLAQRCVKIDKYCVETCCVVGNYYSLRGQHEQAVSYFQRALKLNPSYLSAWTLMGHEYIEMKNTAAGVEAYRRAIDVAPKDFRAWYSLGQLYELRDMPRYALYYYSKAVALRPRDSRMWCALGSTLEELSSLRDSIRAYERANTCEDRDGSPLAKLAVLYERMAHLHPDRESQYTRLAVNFNAESLAYRDSEGIGGSESANAIRYLALHAMKQGELHRAEQFLLRLLEFPGHKNFAKGMLIDVQERREGAPA